MTSDQYNFVTLAYYIPYIIAETPSNLMIKYFKPSVWQSRITVRFPSTARVSSVDEMIDFLGTSPLLSCSCYELRRTLYRTLPAGSF